MIKFKLEKNRFGNIIFKLNLDDKMLIEFPFMKRAILEATKIKGNYNYKVPMRYFAPIFNNLDKNMFTIDEESICSYIEFADEYDDEHLYANEANAKVMGKWRKVGCPSIYETIIDKDTKEISSKIIFSKTKVVFDKHDVSDLLT